MSHKSTENKPQQEGFTLIEVLVGMLMAIVFVLITSEAIAISAVFRVRAQRQAAAVTWIQEDLENIKYQSLGTITGTCAATTTTAGYANALAKLIDGSGVNVPSTTTQSKALVNKSYNMTRTLAAFNLAPYRTMTLSYSVSDPASGLVISNLYTEVIPDAAFNCP